MMEEEERVQGTPTHEAEEEEAETQELVQEENGEVGIVREEKTTANTPAETSEAAAEDDASNGETSSEQQQKPLQEQVSSASNAFLLLGKQRQPVQPASSSSSTATSRRRKSSRQKQRKKGATSSLPSSSSSSTTTSSSSSSSSSLPLSPGSSSSSSQMKQFFAPAPSSLASQKDGISSATSSREVPPHSNDEGGDELQSKRPKVAQADPDIMIVGDDEARPILESEAVHTGDQNNSGDGSPLDDSKHGAKGSASCAAEVGEDSRGNGGTDAEEEKHEQDNDNDDDDDADDDDDEDDDDDGGDSCPICFMPWTSHGQHRLVALKCGHLYGFSCIQRWLNGKNTSCPVCSKPASINQIQHVFATKISMVDTSEITGVREELEREKAARIAAERTASNSLLKVKALEAEIEKLQGIVRQFHHRPFPRPSNSGTLNPSDLAMTHGDASPMTTTSTATTAASMASGIVSEGGRMCHAGHTQRQEDGSDANNEQASAPSTSTSTTAAASFQRMFPGSRTGRIGAYEIRKRKKLTFGTNRCLAFDRVERNIFISAHSTKQTPFFPSGAHGVVKVYGESYSHEKFIPMHTKQIRDIQAGPNGDLILTAAMDKTLRIASSASDNVVQTIKLSQPSWACAWNSAQPVYLYAGLTNNRILVYDIRHSSQPVQELRTGLHFPIISLAEQNVDGQVGLLACDLKGVTHWSLPNDRPATYTRLTELNGMCTSLSSSSASGASLCSYRPSRECNVTRHVVFTLDKPHGTPSPPLNSTMQPFRSSRSSTSTTTTTSEADPRDGVIASVSQADVETPRGEAGRSDGDQSEHQESTGVGEGASDRSTQPEDSSSASDRSEAPCIAAQISRQLLGGPQQAKLAKSHIFSHPQGTGSIVCASNEANCSAMLWDCETGRMFQEVKRLRSRKPYLDFCDVSLTGNGDCIAAIADGMFELMVWQ